MNAENRSYAERMCKAIIEKIEQYEDTHPCQPEIEIHISAEMLDMIIEYYSPLRGNGSLTVYMFLF